MKMVGMFTSPDLRILFLNIIDPQLEQSRYVFPGMAVGERTLEECFVDLVRAQFGIGSDRLDHTIRTIAVARRSVHIAQCHIPEGHPILSVVDPDCSWLEPQFLCDVGNEQWFSPETWKALVAFRKAWAFHNEPVYPG